MVSSWDKDPRLLALLDAGIVTSWVELSITSRSHCTAPSVEPSRKGHVLAIALGRRVGKIFRTRLPPPPLSLESTTGTHSPCSRSMESWLLDRQGSPWRVLLFACIDLFLAVLGLRCCERAFSSCGAWASCSGFSCCRAWTLKHRLSSWGTSVPVPHSMRNLPGPGIEPMSPAVAGRFLTTWPPGKFHESCFW